MGNRTPAEVFAPGEFIAEELEARNWSQIELAEVLGRPPRLISQLITGKCSITPETAKGLGAAFGTGAEFWMNLERDYRLAHAVHDDAAVERRSRLYAKAPVKEMVNRRWIEPSEKFEVLEKRVLDFLHIKSFDEEPGLVHAAKKGASYEEVTSAQWAWLFRIIQIADGISVPAYSPHALTACGRSLYVSSSRADQRLSWRRLKTQHEVHRARCTWPSGAQMYFQKV